MRHRSVRLAGWLAVAALTLTGCATTASTSSPSVPAVTSSTPSATPAASESSATPSASDATPTQTPTPTAAQSATALLAPGATGDQVRELQARLSQLSWYEGAITGTYDDPTTAAVSGFQAKRTFEATGVVDQQTWDSLLSMTRQPTSDEMHNVLVAGPSIYSAGASGDAIRDLQVRLRQIGWYSPTITGSYDAKTVASVKGFQAKRGFPVTGDVDQRTLDRLRSMTRTPTADEKNNVVTTVTASGAIDPRCLTGRVLCIDKSTRKLRWMVDGQVLKVFDVRFGSELTPTREGSFTVYLKSRNHVSTIYHTAMPFAMFFSGGQAVHYSADFAARGYNGSSHGCVNVRDYNGIAWLFDQVVIGDRVIVYRS